MFRHFPHLIVSNMCRLTEVDPAPWRVKHCGCTPEGIQEVMQPFGNNLHKKECSEAANFDFEEVRVA